MSNAKHLAAEVAAACMLLAHSAGIDRDHLVVFVAGDEETAEAQRMLLDGRIYGYIAVSCDGSRLNYLVQGIGGVDEQLTMICDEVEARLHALQVVGEALPWSSHRGKGGVA